jgi:hypothetical protein
MVDEQFAVSHGGNRDSRGLTGYFAFPMRSFKVSYSHTCALQDVISLVLV